MPSWHGTQLKKSTWATLPFTFTWTRINMVCDNTAVSETDVLPGTLCSNLCVVITGRQLGNV
jgi:hypothetical protein